MKWMLTLFVACVFCACKEDAPNAPVVVEPPLAPHSLIPKPLSYESRGGIFIVGSVLTVGAGPGAEVARDILVSGLVADGWSATADARQGQLTLAIAPDSKERMGEEGYVLEVGDKHADLIAATSTGLVRGAMTVRQLMNAGMAGQSMTTCRIEDRPRFPWRGMLLDSGRHFMPKDGVKRAIDLLAYHKLNVFHWHLTEDQGWRIEIKKYPKLTEVGAWRDQKSGDKVERYGGFYSQEDVKEVVAYATARGITVVPEIEMPGHSLAALAAYPHLGCTGADMKVSSEWGVHDDVYCAGNDEVFAFLEDVMAEVLTLFPSKYIHIGGDECPKKRWDACPKCRTRIRDEGLKDSHELQSYFVRRMERWLNARGRLLVGWDEILEGGLAPNATVQSWRGMKGAIEAATTSHDVIASPTTHCYLDFPQGQRNGGAKWMTVVPLDTVYAFEPIPAELPPDRHRHVLGLEGNVWTERIPPERFDLMVFPRLVALAEIGWSPKEGRSFRDFLNRLDAHERRLDRLGVNYYIEPPRMLGGSLEFDSKTEAAFTTFRTDATIRYTTDGSDPSLASKVLPTSITIDKDTTVNLVTVIGPGRMSEVVTYEFKKKR